MESTRPDALVYQRRVDDHFDATARHWKDLYEEPTLDGLIHQQRRAIALRWIDELGLPTNSRVVDLGCGAGLLAVDLAERGYVVDAMDTSDEMVNLARTTVARARFADRVTVTVGDAHRFPFDSGSRDLIVALGVLPFLHSPQAALAEMHRVLKPGGFALMSSDNVNRLNHLLDPRYMPILSAIKKPGRSLARRLGHDWVVPKRFSRRVLGQMLVDANLQPIRSAILGFGPFTLLGWRPMSDSAAIRLHNRLQQLADSGLPGLRSTGAQHLVLAHS